MVKVIGRAHKKIKQNSQIHVFTNGPFKTTSFNPNCHDMYNVEIVEAYQEPITTNSCSSLIKDNEFDTYFKSDIKCQLFVTSSKCNNSPAGFYGGYNTYYNVKTNTAHLTKISVKIIIITL